MIRILTDSTSDISLSRAAQLGVEVLPLTVLFGEESFRDGIDITSEEFYDRLSKVDTLPTTAQIPPETFIDAFQRLTADGSQVLGLFISSEMSGTYQSAMIARSIVGEEKITIVTPIPSPSPWDCWWRPPVSSGIRVFPCLSWRRSWKSWSPGAACWRWWIPSAI